MVQLAAALSLVSAAAGCAEPDGCARYDVSVEPSPWASPSLVALAVAAEPVTFHWTAEGREGWATGDGLGSPTALIGPPPWSGVLVDVAVGGRSVCEVALNAQGAPGELVEVEVAVWESRGAESPYVLGSVVYPHPAVAMWDREGQPVWAVPLAVDALSTMAVPLAGGVAHDAMDPSLGYAWSTRSLLAATGDALAVDDAPLAHHGFAVLPDGGLVWTEHEAREVYVPALDAVEAVVGDRLMQSGSDGSTRAVASTFDALVPAPGNTWEHAVPVLGRDWTHASGVAVGGGRAFVSLRGIDAVMEVDLASGAVLATYGPGGDAPVVLEGGAVLAAPHAPELTDSGLLLFHAGAAGGEAIELAFEGGVAREVWQYGRGLGLFTPSLGAARRTPAGDTLVSFGAAGTVRQVDAAGALVWELRAPAGATFGAFVAVDGL